AAEHVLRPLLVGQLGGRLGVGDAGLAAVAELVLVAGAAERAGDEHHQCATAAAPCSSMSAPVVNRSSANGSASGWGSSWAMVCAYTQPEPGVALKPPVPQPALMNRPSTGVRPMMG